MNSPRSAILVRLHCLSRLLPVEALSTTMLRRSAWCFSRTVPPFPPAPMCSRERRPLSCSAACSDGARARLPWLPSRRGVLLSSPLRGYAKGKDRGGGDGKKRQKSASGGAATFDEREFKELLDANEYRRRLDQQLERLKHDFFTQLALRTSPSALESLTVKLPEGTFPLNHLAKVSAKSAQMFVVNATSSPHAVKAIVSAIKQSGMNVNPQQDGLVIYVPLPKQSREHRLQLAKNAHELANQSKRALHTVYDEFIKPINVKEATAKLSRDTIQRIDAFLLAQMRARVASVDDLEKAKKAELLDELK